MKKKIVRFEVQDLLAIGLTLVVAGIGIVYGMNVLGDVKSDFCAGTNEQMFSGTCYVCNSSHPVPVVAGTCANESQSVAMENVTSSVGGDASVNASVNALKGVGKIPEKMPIIATVIVASVIISILVRYLMVRFA